MRVSNKVLLASLNRDKFEEFKDLFLPYPEIVLVPASEFLRNAEGLKFAEKYDTYLENAIAKARLANKGAHYPSLADDSGIEVSALGNRPGPKSHRYAPPQPGVAQDKLNVDLLLKELTGKTQREAKFVCCLALVIEGVLLHAFGTLEGTIAEKPRGDQGFGYDPIFIPKGFNRTLGEMSEKEKNEISHRSMAVKNLMKVLETHGIALAKP